MNELTLSELKERLAQQYDELQLLDKLHITMQELVDLLEEHIEDNYEDLVTSLEE